MSENGWRSRRCNTIRYYVLAEEMGDQLTSLENCAEMAQFTHEEVHEEALKSTYVWSLGFRPEEIMYMKDVPEHFKTAVEQGDTWITRVFEYEAIGKQASRKKIRSSATCSWTLRSFWRAKTGIVMI
jgi:hypothetical protein